ncbi:nck-associated protein 5-like isoform X2 [Polypterus senegalus]|uniref:nck-associated protein 5-like isoform X2 n=1 Tax=Polypterus senegalus TaxID=55291 RepID=UPI001966CD87|nr:nck-associated protein 5-like isoform X2 [Polypterus senegalus]
MAGSRQQERRELWKRLSLDSSLVECMDSNKCIEDLLNQLEEERRNVRREKLAVARLQREVARSKSEGTMREKLIHELEEERRLRLESEKRLREVTVESEHSRDQMLSLQQRFSRMEETVRNLLQNQGAMEPPTVDTLGIMKVYKGKLSEDVKKEKEPTEDTKLEISEEVQNEGNGTEKEGDTTKLLLERLRALEAENSALAMENETQREQYERCLDEVANQVVQALLTQKDLREECLKLRTRVFDLEQQNRTLSVLFQQRVRPASDLLLQKLHSRIMDLSAGDLISDPERSKIFLRSQVTEAPFHGVQQSMKSAIPVLKCHNQLSLTVPSQLYPRSSCSSSELSLSSACSEFSSGSYTWNDGKSCSKKPVLNWEKRVSITSSAPSNVSSPAEEQPPTRKKESHIIKGLKKLQRRRPMEPSSLMSKWGYKDCMNSNEGIYSPGIKCGAQGGPRPQFTCKAERLGAQREFGKKFAYDSDSHDDADDESANVPTLPFELPMKDCCKKLTHSVSDSLFSTEQTEKPGSGKPPSFNAKEQPEKLTSFINGFFSTRRSCSGLRPPFLQFEAGSTDIDAALQLSDIDDLEALEDLHVESADEKSGASSRLAENQTRHVTISRPSISLCEKDQSKPSQGESRPKTFNLIKQHKVVKKTSSEECITVIFDAEDGEPIELSSHQTGVVSVSRNEISVNQQQTISSAAYTELIPQGMANCQKRSSSGTSSIFEISATQADKTVNKNDNLPRVCSDGGSSEKSPLQNSHPAKLIKPPCVHTPNKMTSVSAVQTVVSQRTNVTKIPSRGKGGSPQKVPKTSACEGSNNGGMSCSTVQEKLPSSPPIKLSRFAKSSGGGTGGCGQSQKAELAIVKHNSQPPPCSKIPQRNESGKTPCTGTPGSPVLHRRPIDSVDYGEPPTRDRQCESFHHELRSPSPPPPPPGRSTSLLIRPSYEATSPVALKPITQNGVSLHPRPHQPANRDPQNPNSSSIDSAAAALDRDLPMEPCSPTPVDDTTDQVQSPTGGHQTPTKGSPKRMSLKTTHISNTPQAQDSLDPFLKSSKNVICGYGPQKGSSLQSTFTSKRGHLGDGGLPLQYKTSCSLPVALHYGAQSQTSVLTHPSPVIENGLLNADEKTVKTRIPLGVKVAMKSPQLLRKSSTVPGKQEKDNINAASKGTVTSSSLRQCNAPEGNHSLEMGSAKSDQEIKGDDTLDNPVREKSLPSVLNDCESPSPAEDKVEGESRLFKRSVSVTTKPHLKPALGMNGAKARSQSFSTHSGDKSSINILEGHGKVRTQIITNTAERGSSLTRQNSAIEGFQAKPTCGLNESPSHAGRGADHSYNRQSSNGNTSNLQGSPSKIFGRATQKLDGSRSTSKHEGSKSPPQKELRSLPLVDKLGLRSFKSPENSKSPPGYSSESTAEQMACGLLGSNRSDSHKAANSVDVPEKLVSPSVSTIEEKVMMGIQENVQKGQGQEKSHTSEIKQKMGPSLASWFGFRKSKLPALSGKKAETSKMKEEKKEAKAGLMLGGKPSKSDKKKDKKKNEHQSKEGQGQANKLESGDRIIAIIDYSNTHGGAPAKQLQYPTACVSKDQFMKELLSRSASKGNSQGSAPPGVSINTQGSHQKSSELKAELGMHNETMAKLVTHKINIIASNDETAGEPTCQDHMIGSNCQMRTLDSGIGTFPLPDSANKATGRHIPKSESDPEKVVHLSPSLREIPSQEMVVKANTLEREVPSTSEAIQEEKTVICHSLSDSVMAAKTQRVFRSQLPLPASSGVIKRTTAGETEQKLNAVKSPEDHGKLRGDIESSQDESCPQTDKTVRACTYSASSSDADTESEHETNDMEEVLMDQIQNGKKIEVDELTVQKNFMRSPISILDFYQHEVYAHYEKDDGKGETHFKYVNSDSHEERSADSHSITEKAEDQQEEPKMSVFSNISLESLNKLNSNAGTFAEKEKNFSKAETGKEAGGNEEASSSCSDKPIVDSLECLSDSLYDSFSSCASQGSNDV